MSIIDAEKYEEDEQYDKAYEEYKRIWVQKPKSLDVLQRLAHVATILGKSDDAAQYYGKILELDATSVVAYEQLMDIYIHSDKYKYYVYRGNLHVVQQELSHAISDFKKALDKTQEIEEMNSTRFVLASLYEQIGKNHQAIDEYLRILDSDTVNEGVFLKLAQVYVKEDSLTSAAAILEGAIERGFDSENIKENLAQIYLRNGQTAEARKHTLDALVQVKSLLDEENNAKAFEILEKSAVDNKKNPQYYSLLAQYYYNIKAWEKALEAVNDFDKFEKNSPLAKTLSYQMRALIFEEQGKDFDSHMNWAKYYLLKGDKDVALNEYFSAFQINDKDAVLIRDMAELLEEVGDKNQANEFWERLANIDSTSRKALEKVADFKRNIGDDRGEAEILEKLYEIDKRNILIVKRLANAYEKIRNKEKALAYYNKYISFAPVDDEYNAIKAKIQKLEGTQSYDEEEGILDKIMKLFIKK